MTMLAALLVASLMFLAIVGTIYQMVHGDVFAQINWMFNSSAWIELLGESLKVLAAGIAAMLDRK